MFFGEINIPDELHVALQTGDVVVFAGAGVSVAPPSGLPSFDRLAERIGEGSGMVREGKRDAGPDRFEYAEPADRYLGRLERRKVKVHERAAELLVGGHTLPHTLHHALLQLSSSSEKVRLVTTNFDTHFSTAAKELGIGVMDEFYAPALPLGNDFGGLVYLHGCAAQRPLRLVLTDEDFGRAYLTEGWVRRFLVSMFARYTVVFVGYSHNDPVMSYLARGLPPEHRDKRFAFVAAGEEESWHHLDVIPIAYPLREGSANPHEALVDSVTKWVAFAKEKLLDRARKIRQVASQAPPLDIETDGQMHLAIKHVETLQPFIDAARTPEWIRWLEEKGVLKGLFGARGALSEELAMLTNWMVGHYLYEYPQAILALVQRNLPHALHPQFCEKVVWRLLHSKDGPPDTMLALWSAVLLNQPDDVVRQESWAQLLQKCQFPRDKSIIGQLFQRASKPELALRKCWNFGIESDGAVKEVEFDIRLDLHAAYYLWESWNGTISHNLDSLACILEPIVTTHLCNARGALAATGDAWEESDGVCSGRASIEPHGENGRPDGIDFLIDAARKILKYVQGNVADRAHSVILNWFDSGTPILRRLAVHGMATQPTCSAEQRVSFVTEHELLFDSVCRPEVFLLLRLNYPQLSAELRSKLLDNIAEGSPLRENFDNDNEDRQYEVFIRFAWLRSVEDSCEQARTRLQALQEKFPHFRIPKYMDVDSWSITQEEMRGVGPAEILDQLPEKFFDDLLELPAGDGIRGREDYACNLWTLVAKNRMWGLEFQRVARVRRLADDAVWRQLGNAWREAKPTVQEWEPIVQEFAHPDTPTAFLEPVVEVLKYWVRREDEGLPLALLESAASIAYRAWCEVLSKLPADNNDAADWLQEAINRPGGYYAELLLGILNRQRPSAGDAWYGIPDAMKERLVEIVSSTSPAAEHGRVILAAQLRWLYGLDPDFAESYLLPLFDWSANSRRAEQCWHGFLLWGNWALNYNDRLLPSFNEAVSRLSSVDGRREDEFQGKLANHVARVAWYVLDNPLTNNWLLERLTELRPQGRVEFAHNIEQILEDSDSKTVANKWECWLERYWGLRVKGIPLPLNRDEANHMVGWSINMPEKFAEAMELVAGMRTVATFQHIMLLDRVVKKNLIENHPLAAAHLILMYLNTKPSYLRADDYLKNVWRKLNHSALPDEVMAKLKEALVAALIDPDRL